MDLHDDLTAALHGAPAWIEIERDDGVIDGHHAAEYFATGPWALEALALDHALDPAQDGAQDGVRGPLLDVGCAAGRILLHAQQRGLDAVGLDLSPGAVAVARARGAKDVRLADVTGDGWTRPGERFATFVLFGNNIGIGETPAALRPCSPGCAVTPWPGPG